MSGLSYADCRDIVSAQLGTCQITNEEMEINLLGVLEDVKNRIGNDPSKNIKTTLSVVKGTQYYSVPSTVERVMSICNADGHELFRVAYPCTHCATTTEPGNPTSWHMDVNQIVLHPVPIAAEVFTIRGTKVRERVLYDVSSSQLKVWRMVDLPVGLHYAYCEAVLAQSIMREDPGRAAVFSASALDKIANWKNDQLRSQGNSRRPMVFGSQAQGNYTWGGAGRRSGSRGYWDPNPVVT